jgi:hypothetical protein
MIQSLMIGRVLVHGEDSRCGRRTGLSCPIRGCRVAKIEVEFLGARSGKQDAAHGPSSR